MFMLLFPNGDLHSLQKPAIKDMQAAAGGFRAHSGANKSMLQLSKPNFMSQITAFRRSEVRL